jgi:hypothetical protein
MLRKIYYSTKVTNSNNTYYEISKEDTDFLITKLLQIQSFMGELSLTKDKDVKDLVKWYTSSNKQYPYSNQFKRYNSPQSFVSGMINNMMFGQQRDWSETQANHAQNIIGMFSQFTTILENEHQITLQKSANFDTVLFAENLWVTTP